MTMAVLAAAGCDRSCERAAGEPHSDRSASAATPILGEPILGKPIFGKR